MLNISKLLFSDQSELAYVENKKEYLNFVDLISNENVLVSDFLEYQILNLNWLKEKKIIYESDKGYIHIRDDIVDILKDFYQNDVICISYYKKNNLLKSFISEKKVICESTLFSKPEQKYLNYTLNNRQFDNGPAIRNKYLHGNNSKNIEEHKNDYFKLLKLLRL